MSGLDHPSEADPLSQIMIAARKASGDMLAAIEGRADTAIVNHDCRSFRTLALMLGRLADECQRLETERMDGPIDGLRFWVAKPQLDAALARADRAEAEVRRLSKALRNATLDAQLVYGDSFPAHSYQSRMVA